MRFGIGFIAPLGRSRSRRYMFIGDVNMWRNFVVGIITKKPRNATMCTTHSHLCRLSSVWSDHVSISPEIG